jgi:hypothetical protein
MQLECNALLLSCCSTRCRTLRLAFFEMPQAASSAFECAHVGQSAKA